MAGEHARDGQTYWAAVRTSTLQEHPILQGSHWGVRVDLDEQDGWEWGRVYTTRELAEAHREAVLRRQRAFVADLAPRADRRGAIDLDALAAELQVLPVVRAFGAPADWWQHAEAVTA